MKYDLAIVGGGLQSVVLMSALTRARYRGTWVVIDPDPLITRWRTLTVQQGMTSLRTSAGRGRHLDYGYDYSLIRHMDSRRPTQVTEDSQPSLAEFNSHAALVISQHNLHDHWFPAKLTDLRRPNRFYPNGFTLRLEGGYVPQLKATKVVVAVGMGEMLLPDCVPPGSQRILHSDQVSITDRRFVGQRVCIVGGGLTAATLAIGLANHGAQVTVAMDHDTTSQLEADPAWLPGGDLHKQFQLLGIERRVGLLQSSRLGRALTPEKHLQLLRLEEQRSIRVLTSFRLNEVAERASEVFVPGLGDRFDYLICCTGYKADVAQLPFLQRLLGSMPHAGGLPVLDRDLEAINVPGLFFMGRYSELQSGPFGRNIPGSWWSARRIVKAIV